MPCAGKQLRKVGRVAVGRLLRLVNGVFPRRRHKLRFRTALRFLRRHPLGFERLCKALHIGGTIEDYVAAVQRRRVPAGRGIDRLADAAFAENLSAALLLDLSGDAAGVVFAVFPAAHCALLVGGILLLRPLAQLGVSSAPPDHAFRALAAVAHDHRLDQRTDGILHGPRAELDRIAREVSDVRGRIAQHRQVSPCVRLFAEGARALVGNALRDRVPRRLAPCVALRRQVSVGKLRVDEDAVILVDKIRLHRFRVCGAAPAPGPAFLRFSVHTVHIAPQGKQLPRWCQPVEQIHRLHRLRRSVGALRNVRQQLKGGHMVSRRDRFVVGGNAACHILLADRLPERRKHVEFVRHRLIAARTPDRVLRRRVRGLVRDGEIVKRAARDGLLNHLGELVRGHGRIEDGRNGFADRLAGRRIYGRDLARRSAVQLRRALLCRAVDAVEFVASLLHILKIAVQAPAVCTAQPVHVPDRQLLRRALRHRLRAVDRALGGNIIRIRPHGRAVHRGVAVREHIIQHELQHLRGLHVLLSVVADQTVRRVDDLASRQPLVHCLPQRGRLEDIACAPVSVRRPLASAHLLPVVE